MNKKPLKNRQRSVVTYLKHESVYFVTYIDVTELHSFFGGYKQQIQKGSSFLYRYTMKLREVA